MPGRHRIVATRIYFLGYKAVALSNKVDLLKPRTCSFLVSQSNGSYALVAMELQDCIPVPTSLCPFRTVVLPKSFNYVAIWLSVMELEIHASTTEATTL